MTINQGWVENTVTVKSGQDSEGAHRRCKNNADQIFHKSLVTRFSIRLDRRVLTELLCLKPTAALWHCMPNTHVRTKMQAPVLRGRSGSGSCKQRTRE